MSKLLELQNSQVRTANNDIIENSTQNEGNGFISTKLKGNDTKDKVTQFEF